MPAWGFNKPAADNQGGSPLPDDISEEWVERHIVPRLQALSRRGIIVSYDSGIEPQSKARQQEEQPDIVAATPNDILELPATATDVVGFDVARGNLVSGYLRYTIRAATASQLQCIVGSVYFAAGLQASGSPFSMPTMTPSVPQIEVLAASSGTLQSLWSFLMTGSDAESSLRSTLRVRPVSSLSVGTFAMSYHYTIF